MNNDFENLNIFNVKFIKISKDYAKQIIKNEFPCSLLLSYSDLFEKYIKTENQGKFVNLDFAHLYYLTKIDEQLRQILIKICLEIELKIKTILIADAEKLDVEKTFLKEYIQSDLDYLSKTYPEEIGDIILNIDTNNSPFYNFTSFVLFGTFEKFVRAFYGKYARSLYGKAKAPFEKYLSSVRRIRNMVAHNSPILSKLSISEKLSNNSLSQFLASKGIKSKTLHTNLSKPVVFDICATLRLYCGIQTKENIKKTYKDIKKFLFSAKRRYGKILRPNQTLTSAYNFFKNINKIFSEELAIY